MISLPIGVHVVHSLLIAVVLEQNFNELVYMISSGNWIIRIRMPIIMHEKETLFMKIVVSILETYFI
jgi:hypothetical protein